MSRRSPPLVACCVLDRRVRQRRTSSASQRAAARRRRPPRRRRRRQSNTPGEQSEFFDQAGLRQAARAARRRARGPGRPAVGAGDRAGDGRHRRVQVRPGTAGTSASRTPRSTTRGAQVGWTTMQAEVEALARRDRQVHGRRRRGERRQADLRHRGADPGGNCDALIVSPNTTATLTPAVEQACETESRSSCSTAASTPTARSRSSTRSAATPSAPTRPSSWSTTSSRAARSSPCGSCRAWTCSRPAGRRQGDLRRGRPERRRRRVHRRRRRQDQVDRLRLHPARGRARRRLDGRRRDLRRRHRGVRGRRPGHPADHRRGPARLPDQVAGGRPDRGRARPTRTTSGARRSSPRPRSSRARKSRRSGSCRSRTITQDNLDQYVDSRTCRRCTTRCAAARTCRASPRTGVAARISTSHGSGRA